MTELAQISLIAFMVYGHVRLMLDDRLDDKLSPTRYDPPYGFASFFVDGRFINYIDLRQ